ncbi:MAG: TIGR04283 family arsenosugar biosynthesis glycosyltransferase [Rhodoblastus sp.]
MDTLAARPAVSIVIPVLDEAEAVVARLGALAPLRAAGAELVLVDGGSADRTLALAAPHADIAIAAPRGRARQMNAGAVVARGGVLIFLHADTLPPSDAIACVQRALADSRRVWGRFDVRIVGAHPLLPAVATLMNLRSRMTGIATGDQALFVTRPAFERAGGFPDIPLMEDIALSKALKRLSRPACLTAKVSTSGRRWDKNGFWRTIFLMWRLRLAYFFGADPARLARAYGYAPDA